MLELLLDLTTFLEYVYYGAIVIIYTKPSSNRSPYILR